jgi:hypothetical protein
MSERSSRLDYGVASPPDDGGDRGSFASPDELLDVAPQRERGRYPELAIDCTRPRPPAAGSRQIVALLVIAGVAVPILWAYCTL